MWYYDECTLEEKGKGKKGTGGRKGKAVERRGKSRRSVGMVQREQ